MIALILAKVHGNGSNSVLAVCDKELCGKTLKSGRADFVVSKGFYEGKEISEKRLKTMLHEFENINIVGNKAVQLAMEEGIACKENVIEIGKIKHVQIFKI